MKLKNAFFSFIGLDVLDISQCAIIVYTIKYYHKRKERVFSELIFASHRHDLTKTFLWGKQKEEVVKTSS